MVGSLRDPTIEEDLSQRPSKLDKSDDPLPLDFSLSELEDFSVSFADSFLDFDSVEDWIEDNPVLDIADSKPDTEKVDLVKMEDGAVGGCKEMDKDGSCGETAFGDGFQKLENLGSLIEEEIRRVSLEGGLDGLVVADTGITGADGIGGMSGQPASVSGNGAESVEIVDANENGVKSGETLGVNESGWKSAEIVTIDGDGPKSDETASDSDSISDSDSSSSSSSSSSSGSEEEEEDDNEEEKGEEVEEEGTEVQEIEKEEGEIDMEEGEIRDSDVEQMVAWSDDDEEDGGVKEPIRSKNEIKVLPPVPPVNVTLQPHHQTLPVGIILSVMGTQVVVEGVEKHNPLNEGSILWITESRSPLGLVDEIFGPVKNPYYIIRYNSENEVPAGVEHGTSISFVPEFAEHVLNDSNLYKKGYDASGENDEELSEAAEFSDDEEEAEYKRMLKMTKRGTNDPKIGNKKKDRKKFKNRGGTWHNGQPSTPQTLEGVHQLPTKQNQHCAPPLAASMRQNSRPSTSQTIEGVHQLPTNQNQHGAPPLAASMDHGNYSHPFGAGQGFACSPGLVPTFPQLVQAPGFIPTSSGVWTNGMPCEQQQNMVFPNGVPTNGMPWLQQNQYQQSYQMPLLNRMPFQQQFVPSQSLPSNMVLPGAQSNFCAGPAFAPWPGCLGQSGFNQPFGMGLQLQQAPMSMNVGEQPRPPIPGNIEASQQFNQGIHHGREGNNEVPQQFNQGMHRGRGKKPYNRGGGRFGGGRGRQQSK